MPTICGGTGTAVPSSLWRTRGRPAGTADEHAETDYREKYKGNENKEILCFPKTVVIGTMLWRR
jgi:hypothetical protein